MNISPPTIEPPCEAWKSGECADYRKKIFNLNHNLKFCRDGKNCKIVDCLSGNRRYCDLCKDRQRWQNSETCQFRSKWKKCSYFHPELLKNRAQIKDDPGIACEKCKPNQEEAKVESMKNNSETILVENMKYETGDTVKEDILEQVVWMIKKAED